MAIGLPAEPRLLPVAGVRVGTAAGGIGRRVRDDIAVFELAEGSTCAATFTRNRFCAAPVLLARRHLADAAPRYLLVNAGNANAGTGEQGVQDALACCASLAQAGGCRTEQVLPFSTGVIGERLPVERMRAAIPRALACLDTAGWLAAARAIMTTDTLPKGCSLQAGAGPARATVTGIVKGAGMIRPDMATMLAFIATDAAVPADLLRGLLVPAVETSFNRITVDGDTSTNDACVLVATGRGALDLAQADAAGRRVFAETVSAVCRELAQAVVRDAEGVTKFIAVHVYGGADEGECLRVAYAVAHSPLVKTALYASDPNWGRILAAVGRAGPRDLDVSRVRIALGDLCIVEDGGRSPGYTEEAGQQLMNGAEITVSIDLARGCAATTVWTTDLSHEYVRINAEYRT